MAPNLEEAIDNEESVDRKDLQNARRPDPYPYHLHVQNGRELGVRELRKETFQLNVNVICFGLSILLYRFIGIS